MAAEATQKEECLSYETEMEADRNQIVPAKPVSFGDDSVGMPSKKHRFLRIRQICCHCSDEAGSLPGRVGVGMYDGFGSRLISGKQGAFIGTGVGSSKLVPFVQFRWSNIKNLYIRDFVNPTKPPPHTRRCGTTVTGVPIVKTLPDAMPFLAYPIQVLPSRFCPPPLKNLEI